MTLDDDLILWQIALLQHDAYLRRELIRRLDNVHRQAFALLMQGKALNNKAYRALSHEIQQVLQEGYTQAGQWLDDAMVMLLPVAAVIAANIYGKHLGKGFAAPEKLNMPPIYGASVMDWLKQQGAKHSFVMQRQLRRMRNEENVLLAEIGAEVRQYLKRGNAQSEALVRTAAAVAANEANIAVIRKSKRVKYLIHKSHLDSHTTGICRSRHNKRWNAQTLEPIAHDLPYQQPPLHWNCRSIIKPLLNDGLRPEDNYSFEEWLDKMPPNIQDKALGKGKAALWRKMKEKGQSLTI